MKILLIGNYPYLYSKSMDRFASVLQRELDALGHNVRLLKPSPVFGRILPSPTGFGKWLGYFDRLLLFLPFFNRAAKWADIVHICDQANAIYVPWLKNSPHLVTCHDMLAIRSAMGEIPEHLTGWTGRIYQRWILRGLKKANHLVCVSESTREDVMRIAKCSQKNISVVHNGFNHPYLPMAAEDTFVHLDELGLRYYKPFFLHVGNNNWYKNKAGVLRIFSQLIRLDSQKVGSLVLVGQGCPENLHLMMRELGIANRIRILTEVSNEQLRALYSASEGLIFPSLGEGFGWPIVEAQSCGCPVFTSNRRPLTDIAGAGAVFFDPRDELTAAKTILHSLSDKKRLQENGFLNSQKYATELMISDYERLYSSIAN